MMQEGFAELDHIKDGDDTPSPESYDEALDQALVELKQHVKEDDAELDMSETRIKQLFNESLQDLVEDSDGDSKIDFSLFEGQTSQTNELNDLTRQDDGISGIEEKSKSLNNHASNKALADLDPGQISKIEDLQSILPGMPLGRLRKILDAYEKTLGHPSMLTLVPILRETMPDYLSSGRLKRSNKLNADFALQKASEDGIVDSSLLNSMLEVKANAGSLNEALEYREIQFAKHKLVSLKMHSQSIQ